MNCNRLLTIYSNNYLHQGVYVIVVVGPIANLNGPYFQPSVSVCVSVCVFLTGTSTLQR